MKKMVFFLVFIVATGLSSHAAEKTGPMLRAGSAAVDVSPREFPVNMPGLFRRRPVRQVHDPLHARALVLDDGTTTVALVVVDNLHVAEEACDEAKALASKQCGIAVEKMLVASTHTHTAPSSNVKKGPAPEVAYRKLLVEGIAESIARAHAALRPAGVGAAAKALPEEVFCRRWFLKPGKMPPNPFGELDKVKMNPSRSPEVLDRPAGPTDPDVTILSVQDAESGKPLALLANYSLHYVGGVPKEMISADYFGEFARLLQSRVDNDDFVLPRRSAPSQALRADPGGCREGCRCRVAGSRHDRPPLPGRQPGHGRASGHAQAASPHGGANRESQGRPCREG